MNKYLIAIALALGLSACGTTNETLGTVGGAALGGAVGSAVTGGSTLGTIGGAAIGGVVGNRVGDDYDKKHPR